MHKHPDFFLVNIIALLVLTACTAATLPAVTSTVQPLPSATPTRVTSTPTLVPPTSTPEPSPTTPPVLGYASLPDGEYLIYETPYEIGAFSLEQGTQTRLVNKIPAGFGSTLSPDLHHVVYIPWQGHRGYMFDLATGQKSEYPFLSGCDSATLSVNNQYFLAVCAFEENQPSQIYLIAVDGSGVTLVSKCEKALLDCSYAHLSPDGNWFTYYSHYGGSWSTPPWENGIGLVKIACFDGQTTCDSAEYGPFSIEIPHNWSPNSQYLATCETDAIAIYQFENTAIKKIKSIDIEPGLFADAPVWSPDSTQLAYVTQDEVIMMIRFDGSETREIEHFPEDAALLGWVVIKDGEVVR